MGHEQTSRHVRVMSVIPLKADIHRRGLRVGLVPKADLGSSNRGACLSSFCEAQAVDATKNMHQLRGMSALCGLCSPTS